VINFTGGFISLKHIYVITMFQGFRIPINIVSLSYCRVNKGTNAFLLAFMGGVGMIGYPELKESLF